MADVLSRLENGEKMAAKPDSRMPFSKPIVNFKACVGDGPAKAELTEISDQLLAGKRGIVSIIEGNCLSAIVLSPIRAGVSFRREFMN
jgi:hypothetical protein